MIGTGLAYVGVVVRDVGAVAKILERDFQIPRFRCAIGSSGRHAPVFPVGRTAVALFELGDAFVGSAEKTGVHHLAVSVDDLEDAGRRVEESGVPLLSSQPEPGLNGCQRLLLDPKATGGVIAYLSEPLAIKDSESEGSERERLAPVERIDHIGVASRDNRQAMEVFSRRLGWTVESTQTDAEMSTTVESFTSDKYGVTYHARPPEFVGGLKVAFLTIGDCDLEFLQDLDQANLRDSPAGNTQRGQPGSTRQDQGVISRYIDSRGAGLHHIALKVRDIDGLLGRLRDAGHTMIDTHGRPGSRLGKIGFIHPASLGGLLVHLVQREELPSS